MQEFRDLLFNLFVGLVASFVIGLGLWGAMISIH